MQDERQDDCKVNYQGYCLTRGSLLQKTALSYRLSLKSLMLRIIYLKCCCFLTDSYFTKLAKGSIGIIAIETVSALLRWILV